MNVHSASSVLLYAASMALSQSNRQHAAASPANTADTVSISQAARDLYASVENQAKPAVSAGSNVKTAFDTTKGRMDLDIESYFAPQGSDGVDLDSVPLLLPSQKNIETLSNYLSAQMPGFLADKGIPMPPASMTYDSMGQIELPADYPYAAEFKQALKDNPAMERALRTTSALASHVVEMNKSIPFQREYAAATSQTQIDAVVAKYHYLFSANRHYDSIALNFTTDGILSITHDGKPLSGA